MTTPYAPPKTPQIDGSRYQNENCTWAVTNDHIDAATLGRKRPGSATLRRQSGDTSGGSAYTQNANVADQYYGITLEPKLLDERVKFRDGVASGRRASASINCAVTVKTSRRTNYFTGTHTVFAMKWRLCKAGGRCKCELRSSANQHGEFLVEDPGTTAAGYLWWSSSLLCRAMEARAALEGIDGLIVMFGPDTEGVRKTTRQSALLHTSPSSTSGTIGSVDKGTVLTALSTTNGKTSWDVDGSGPSTRRANGWVKVRLASGKVGWLEGKVAF